MSNTDVIKRVAKYLGTSPGSVCLTSDKVVVSTFGKESISGFASVLIHLAKESKSIQNHEQACLNYQWLEYAAKYIEHASKNPALCKKFLQEINRTLEYNSYLTGQRLSISDVALCILLHPFIEALSYVERESLTGLCRWSKHVNAHIKLKA